MEHFTNIGTLRKILVEHYHSFHQKMSFDQALSEAIRKGLCMQAAPFLPVRTNQVMDAASFINMINQTYVEAELILRNPKKNIISEEYIIPEQKDIETVCHLPFVNDRMHQHNHFEIDYMYRGKALLEMDDRQYVLSEQDLCIIPPGMDHNLMVEEEDSIVIGIIVRQSTFDTIFGSVLTMDDLLGRYFKNVLYNNNNRHSLRFHIDSEDEIFAKLIQDIVLETHSDERYSNAVANCLVQEMFFLLLRGYSSTASYFSEDAFMTEQSQFLMILEYTQKHYASVSLEFLSEFFNYSKSHLSRMFKNKMNMNFSDLLLSIRMKKAEDLLENSEYSISEISERIGYTSVDYFTKAFKKSHQMTPSQFRKKVML